MPLTWAAKCGEEEMVKLLLSQEDVAADSRAIDGRTPLSYAAQRGQGGIAKLLLSRDDVSANSVDNMGRTWLFWAIASRASLLRSTFCGTHIMAQHHLLDEVVTLFLSREDVAADIADREGRTPLSLAAEWGFIGDVELLLSREDVSAALADNHGRTPLSHAVGNGHVEVARLLLDRKEVRADLKDSNGLALIA